MAEVSVIIPTYNRSGYVREAVASVLAQTSPACELIVVDDGSTDNTAESLQPFGKRIEYLYRAHGGVSAARNTGILHARGDWLAFLDSDDLWMPRKLAVQKDFVAGAPHLKINQTGEIWIRNGVRINIRKYHRKPEGYCFEKLLDRCLVSPSAVMIHRELFDQVGVFDESLPACEDYDLWLRIACSRPIGLVDEPLVVKRGGHPDQLSCTVPALDLYRLRSLAKLLRFAPLSQSQRKAAFDALSRKCAIYAEGCRKRGKADEARLIMALPKRVAKEVGFVSDTI